MDWTFSALWKKTPRDDVYFDNSTVNLQQSVHGNRHWVGQCWLNIRTFWSKINMSCWCKGPYTQRNTTVSLFTVWDQADSSPHFANHIYLGAQLLVIQEGLQESKFFVYKKKRKRLSSTFNLVRVQALVSAVAYLTNQISSSIRNNEVWNSALQRCLCFFPHVVLSMILKDRVGRTATLTFVLPAQLERPI